MNPVLAAILTDYAGPALVLVLCLRLAWGTRKIHPRDEFRRWEKRR